MTRGETPVSVRRRRGLLACTLLALGAGLPAAAGDRLILTGPPTLVLPKLVSTAGSEIKIAFSPDGSRALWGTISREGGAGGWDIWESRREAGEWGPARPVPFNSPQNDFDPFIAPDGRAVFFFSNRPGGLGGDDIYRVPIDSETGTYGTAQNLGPAVNSAGDEWAPVLSPDGKRLLFASDGRGGRGLHDLFVARRDKEGWRSAQPLGGAVNSTRDDFDAAFLHDGRTLVFTRRDREQDGAELFVSFEEGGRYAEPERLGPEANAAGAWNLGPASNPSEPGILYFTSHRAEASEGRSDIYRIAYRIVRKPATGSR